MGRGFQVLHAEGGEHRPQFPVPLLRGLPKARFVPVRVFESAQYAKESMETAGTVLHLSPQNRLLIQGAEWIGIAGTARDILMR